MSHDRQLIIKFLTGEGKADDTVNRAAAALQAKKRDYDLEANDLREAPSLGPNERKNLILLSGRPWGDLRKLLQELTPESRLCLVGHGNWQMQTLGGWTPIQVAALIAPRLKVGKISLSVCEAARTRVEGYREEIARAQRELYLLRQSPEVDTTKLMKAYRLTEKVESLTKDRDKAQEEEETLVRQAGISSDSFAGKFHWHLGDSFGVFTVVLARVLCVSVLDEQGWYFSSGAEYGVGRKVTWTPENEDKQEFQFHGQPGSKMCFRWTWEGERKQKKEAVDYPEQRRPVGFLLEGGGQHYFEQKFRRMRERIARQLARGPSAGVVPSPPSPASPAPSHALPLPPPPPPWARPRAATPAMEELDNLIADLSSGAAPSASSLPSPTGSDDAAAAISDLDDLFNELQREGT
jgi:hypothetical protein